MEGNENILERRRDKRREESKRILIPRIQDGQKQRRTGEHKALGENSNVGITKSVEFGRAKVRKELERQDEVF